MRGLLICIATAAACTPAATPPTASSAARSSENRQDDPTDLPNLRYPLRGTIAGQPVPSMIGCLSQSPVSEGTAPNVYVIDLIPRDHPCEQLNDAELRISIRFAALEPYVGEPLSPSAVLVTQRDDHESDHQRDSPSGRVVLRADPRTHAKITASLQIDVGPAGNDHIQGEIEVISRLAEANRGAGE